MPPEVTAFLSYPRRYKDWAQVLHQHLEACGEKVYLDLVDVGPGRSWVQQVQAGLTQAQRVILVVTPESIASERVMDEWQGFVSAHREYKSRGLLQIAYLLDAELPFFLNDIQYVDFREHDDDVYFQRLSELLAGLRGVPDLRSLPPLPSGLRAPSAPRGLLPRRLRKELVNRLAVHCQTASSRAALAKKLGFSDEHFEGHPSAECAASAVLTRITVEATDEEQASALLLSKLQVLPNSATWLEPAELGASTEIVDAPQTIVAKKTTIVYAKKQEAWTRALAENLRACGLSVFCAANDVTPGRSWVSMTQSALSDSSCLLLIVTPESMAERWVHQQCDAWISKKGDPGLLIPVLLQRTPLPPLLASRQGVDFRGYDAQRYSAAVGRIVEKLGGKAASVSPLSVPAYPAPFLPENVQEKWEAALTPHMRESIGRRGIASSLDLPPKVLDEAESAECAAAAALVLTTARGDDSMVAAMRAVNQIRAALPQAAVALDEIATLLQAQAASTHAFSAWQQQLQADTREECASLPACFHGVSLAQVYVEICGSPLPHAAVILGPAGSGKSVLLRHLAATLPGLTLYLRLPALLQVGGFFLDEYETNARRLGYPPGVRDHLDKLGREGQLTLLLDDLDKVPREERREAHSVLAQLRKRWPRSTMLYAVRPLYYQPVDGFQELRLTPLTRDQRIELLARRIERASALALMDALQKDPLLWELSSTPLALAVLLAESTLTAEKLPGRLLGMLISGEYRGGHGMLLEQRVTQALAHLARQVKTSVVLDELVEELLKAPAWVQLRTHARWGDEPRQFLEDVANHTGILGPYDGPSAWRFLSQALRQALLPEAERQMPVQLRSMSNSLAEIEREPDIAKRKRRYQELRFSAAHAEQDVRRLSQLALRVRDGDELYFINDALVRASEQTPELFELIYSLQQGLLSHLPPPPKELFQPDWWKQIPGARTLLSMTHVTRQQYLAFDPDYARRRPSRAQDGPDHPAVAISWFAASMFCRWLSNHLDGEAARLPQKQEWLRACQGDGDHLLERAWYHDKARLRMQRVAQLGRSRAGFFDLPGNVREWCLDADTTEPSGDGEEPRRVVCGASFLDGPERVSPASCFAVLPMTMNDLIGFRVVLDKAPRTRSTV